MQRNYFYFILVIIVNTTLLFAQDLSFYHYGLEKGLSQQTIRCILKDSKGFLWLGTQDGLNRFDGNTFRVFRKNESDSLAVSGKFINDIIENKDGTIWIATANNGVCFYNSKTDVFSKTQFETGNCTSLLKDNQGNVYATSLDSGVFMFTKHGESYKFKHLKPLDDMTLLISSSIIIDDNLYLGSADGRIFKVNLNEHKSLNFEELNLDKPLGIINEMYVFDNKLLIGTSIGLFQFQPKSKNLINLQLKQYNNPLTESLVIESLTSKNNILYVGTDNGLYILKDFNPKNHQFENVLIYKGDKDNINSITSNRVYDILIDNDLIWIGTNNLDVASLKTPVFKTINSLSSPAINNNYVFSILKTEDYTFIGTRDGLNCIDNFNNITYITMENTDQALAYNVIRGMAIDAKNNLWLATTKGVSVLDLNNFDPEHPRLISLFSEKNNINSLSDNKTRSVFLDHNNYIWITTYGGGINRFIGNLEESIYAFERYNYNPNKNSISSNFTFNITQDADSNYWITSENGLNKLKFKSSSYSDPNFTVYKADKTNTASLKSNTTLHTYHDKDGILWVATQNGLHKFNKADTTFKQYNESHGLSNTYVYSILEDKMSHLWISTNSGLFKFDKRKERFTQFTIKDGLQSTEFNLGASFNDTINNQLYFGGINGFNSFNPKTISQLDTHGQLLLTELRIKGKIINPVNNSKVLKTSITESKSIKLNYDDFPCTIAFSDLNLRPQKNTQFVYRLNNSDWNSIKESREIQLLDLPKGKHNIELQGKSRNKLWKTDPLQLAIIVSPPWYKSNLAYLLYLLGFLGIMYAFYTTRLQRQIAGQESKRLQELDNLKSRFITNITHEFRTPLTIILGYLGNLKEHYSAKNDVSTSLDTIEQNSNNLLNLVNQMLDLAKLEKGQLNLNLIQNDIVSFSKQIVQSFVSIASDKRINLNFSSNQNEIIMDFDAEKMRQILTNLISNALKFSPENSKIKIKVENVNNSLKLEVKDDGYGISKDELPFIFDRFFQVENNEHQITQGTGIGLALTKELVELLNGTIEVTSKLNKGTSFTITLPITNIAQEKQLVQLEKQMTFGTAVPQLDDSITDEDTNRVLIVEDNADMARYIASCLQPDYKVSFAKDGKKGLESAKQNIPDVVITDVMMPIMDGYEFTEKLQSNTTTNHIPIIMLTSKAMQEDKIQGITSGADAYLTKPFQKEELRLRMQMLISKRKKLQENYAVNTVVGKTEQKKDTTDKNLIFLNTVIDAIHKNLDNSNFGATELAKFMAMSDSQLYRKLKAISNTSTAIFIRKVRLEKGKELLKTTHLSVSEIAYTTGFNDPNWFSKAFKEEYDQSPTEYRN
ncbi:hybrid sensor histidine kinase/response regulator transcription factor [Winogradskyella schleiferi]|uniref:hybrid sensor histidine kinase/response regulator transcription factor n=1 Tax=Winogradskyella schleiferi TaxID=2686078 RepID=UPI0015BA4753|nr:two-component regulator propeller domain-containing protein [Winogradskyella schleiferi]